MDERRVALHGLRIAIITQPFDTILAGEEQHGSVAIVNWELARCLAERHEVTVWAPRRKGQLAEERFGSIRICRLPVVLDRFHKLVSLLQGRLGWGQAYTVHPLFHREYALQLAHAFGREQVDAVLMPTLSQFGPLLRRGLPHARLVLHAHGDELLFVERERGLRYLRAFDGVVTVSEFVSQGIRTRYPDYARAITTIGNGVDTKRFQPHLTISTGGRKRLLFVSRVSPDKGVHVLLEAFDRLARERDDVELDIVGKPGFLPLGFMRLHFDDPVMADLARFYGRGLIEWLRKEVFGQRTSYIEAIRARLSPVAAERLRFRGFVPIEELARLYTQADLFVLPSLWHETFGIPLIEAMASGVPTVASRCGGIPEIVIDGVTGRLVERGDVDGIVTAIRNLLDDPDRRIAMGRAGRERVEAHFTWHHSAQRLEKVLT
jgi:glycosyltransferase involved in cell wall biosynthesis